MEKIVGKLLSQQKVLPQEEYVLFRDLKNWSFPAADSAVGAEVISYAEAVLDEEFPLISARVLMRFVKDGNRNEHWAVYHKRRVALIKLLAAECIEKKGRFIGKIMDIAWAITEETSWIIPAHNNGMIMPICCGREIDNVDLFAAETGAVLSAVYYFCKDAIAQEQGQVILERILYEIDRQIIKPFMKVNHLWWMGMVGRRPNNWNPWIISNVLTCASLAVEDTALKQQLLERCSMILDYYIAGVPEDGGCDEGPGYWSEAGGCVFDCLELMYDMIGGSVDFFQNEALKQIMEYICKVHINDFYYVTYGDAHAESHVNAIFCRRIGRRFGSALMEGFGQQFITETSGTTLGIYNVMRVLKGIVDSEPSQQVYAPAKFILFPNMQLCMLRETTKADEGFYAWLKGGHNKESHNHNDVGSIGVYLDGKPVMIDIGVGTYTKATFSELRYTLFPINTVHHNLPMIGGKGQGHGQEYRTNSFEANEEKMFVKAGLADAYENKEDIISFERSLDLKDGVITLTDDIKLKTAQEILFQYYLLNKPIVKDANTVEIGGGAVMVFEDGWKPVITEIVLEDASLRKDWKTDTIYHLAFRTEGSVESVCAKFRIQRKAL